MKSENCATYTDHSTNISFIRRSAGRNDLNIENYILYFSHSEMYGTCIERYNIVKVIGMRDFIRSKAGLILKRGFCSPVGVA